MSRQLDIGSTNPRLQCAACGRWMRLHGKRLEAVDGKVTEVAVQRFYGGCDHNNGGDHLAVKPDNNEVCDRCCQIECKAIAAKKCQRVRDGEKYWKCDRCESIWTNMLHDTDWRPSACPERRAMVAEDGTK